jgi:uncharacterized DUF497 family protein
LSVIINDIIWLDTVLEKLAWKHRVLPHEVEEVLSGKCRIFKKESGDVEGEDLCNALGKTEGGRYLSVFFIRKFQNKALIITARGMNRRERRKYEKG